MANLQKIQQAKDQGFTEEEILSVLSEDQGLKPKISQALSQGFSNKEILSVLGEEKPVTIEAPVTKPPLPAAKSPPTRGVGETFGRTALEAGLSTLGGVVGGMAAGVPGALAGGTLGYAEGREIGDLLFGEEVGNIGEELVEAGENLLEGAKLEAMGYIIPVAGKHILTKAGKALFRPTKFTLKQIKRLRAAKKLDVPITVGEASDSRLVKRGEQFFRKLFLPSGRIQQFDEKGFKALIKERDRLLEGVSGKLTPEDAVRIETLGIKIQNNINKLLAGKVQARGRVLEKIKSDTLKHFGATDDFITLGRTAKEVIETRRQEFRDVSKGFFKAARKSLPLKGEESIATISIVDEIDKAIAKEKKGLTSATRGTVNLLENIRNDFLIKGKTAVTLKDTFNGVVRKRSDLNDLISKAQTTIGLPGEEQLITSNLKVASIFKKIKAALDVDLQQFAKKSGFNVDKLVEAGIGESRRGFQFAEIPNIQKIIKSQPDQVADILLKSGPAATKRLLSDLAPHQKVPLKRSVVGKLLGTDIDEVFTGSAAQKRIKQSGETTVRELLGDEADEFLDFARRSVAVERSVARLRTTGVIPKELGLDTIDLAGNKFYRRVIAESRPENIVDIVFVKGNTKNIKRVFASLRAMDKPQVIRDLKAAYLKKAIVLDPVTDQIMSKETVTNFNKLGPDSLRAAFTPEELAGIEDFKAVLELIQDRALHGGEGSTIVRLVSEPILGPVAHVHFLRDGRKLIKKALRQIKVLPSDIAGREVDKTLTKLLILGLREEKEAELRDIRRVE